MESITDLKYLEGICKGDAARMKRYIEMFLTGAPPLFDKMEEHLQVGDAESLSRTAHSLKPQANYMGATALFIKLGELEMKAKEDGAEACEDLLEVTNEMNLQVIAELRAALLQMPS